MVDSISTNAPVANVAIPATSANGNSVEGRNTTSSTNAPSNANVDQVNISQEAQVASRAVFSERPDLRASQQAVIELPEPSQIFTQAPQPNDTPQAEVVSIPPANAEAVQQSEDRSSANEAQTNSAIADLVEL